MRSVPSQKYWPSYSIAEAAERMLEYGLIVSNWKTSVPPTKDPRITASALQKMPEGAFPGPPLRAMPRTIF
jgi:hypothetical protein